eukprot:jgi/Botrbrau1/3085/Bobra.0070s0072.2
MAELVLPRESTIEFILTNEPSFTKSENLPTSTLATVPDFLRKEFRVPVVAGTSSSAAFWLCVQEYETYDDLSVVISDVQEKLSDATASLRQRHASWLAAHASSYTVAPTAIGANTAFAAYQTAIRDLQSATKSYWDYKFLLRDLEGPIPSYAGDLTVALEAHREETNARLTVVDGDVRSMKDSLAELRDLLLKGTPPLTPTTEPPLNPEFPLDYDQINRSSFPSKPIRVPPPKFDGSKEGTKVTTWFEQFDGYASLMHIAPGDLVANASLCLSGRAAEQWALMKKSLTQRGGDPRDFSTF